MKKKQMGKVEQVIMTKLTEAYKPLHIEVMNEVRIACSSSSARTMQIPVKYEKASRYLQRYYSSPNNYCCICHATTAIACTSACNLLDPASSPNHIRRFVTRNLFTPNHRWPLSHFLGLNKYITIPTIRGYVDGLEYRATCTMCRVEARRTLKWCLSPKFSTGWRWSRGTGQSTTLCKKSWMGKCTRCQSRQRLRNSGRRHKLSNHHQSVLVGLGSSCTEDKLQGTMNARLCRTPWILKILLSGFFL